jgi:uncharacterized repeat protein (TIGR03803 family)
MIALRFGRYAFGASALVAMLAGCGGDNTPLNVAPVGVTAERTRTSVSYSVLFSFNGSDGAYPHAGLINVKATLYGTTSRGGSPSNGTVFSITTSGTERRLYSFGPGDGAYPIAGLLNVNGTLYGTTSGGGRKRRRFDLLVNAIKTTTPKVSQNRPPSAGSHTYCILTVPAASQALAWLE